MHKHLLIIIGLALAAPAAAQTPSEARLTADLARADRQDARIDAGIASGQINPHEQAHLERRSNRIDRSTTRLAADGRYSRVDAARIDRRQDTSSRRIAVSRRNRR